jgi:two-component system, OmpR family, sensor histidine kinase TctE
MPVKTPELPRSLRLGRFGIRARLLTLLLPAVVALLAFDSWNDYQALKAIVEDAYDQALLEPLSALDNSVTLAADGTLRVSAPFDVQAMFEQMRPRFTHLHLGLAAIAASADEANSPAALHIGKGGAAIGPETTLTGVSDLPPVPRATRTVPPDSHEPVWYDGVYHGYAVRIAALRRTVFDGQGKPYQLLSQAAESTGPREQALASTLRQEILRDARMLAAVILLVWLGVGWSLWPLKRLQKSVLASPPDALVPLDAAQVPYEVRPLVEAVNHHMASHRQVLARQAGFLADASHQLRTPLAILLTQAAYALREPDVGRIRETLRAIVAQLSRSRRLSEQLLALAHASEPQAYATSSALVDMNALARDVVLQYLPLAHEKNQDLGWVHALGDNAPPDSDELPAGPQAAITGMEGMVAPVLAHAEELHEALANLVHNAVVYTPAGGTITVATRLENQWVCVEVCDNGPGIAADQRVAAFGRFVQLSGHAVAGAARHGAGLGLSIAKGYAQRNKGDIELADADPRADGPVGLRAILRLPRATLQDPHDPLAG